MPQLQSEIPQFTTGDIISGSSLRVTYFGVSLPGVKKVSFGKKVVKENIYGTGNKPVGRAYGQETYEASLTLLMSDVLAIMKASVNSDPTQNEPSDLIVSFLRVGRVVTAVLPFAEFTEWMFDIGTEDTKIEVELPLIIGEPYYKRFN